MLTLLSAHRLALSSQHQLRRDDYAVICHLVQAEGVTEDLESLDFDQFLGLACYLLLTTTSQQTREQLSQLLPKFGSGIVLPLVKILNHFPSGSSLGDLARQALNGLTTQSLVIGSTQILQMASQKALKPSVIELLSQRMGDNKDPKNSVTSLLSELLLPADFQEIKTQLHQQNPSSVDYSSPIQINVLPRSIDQSPNPRQVACAVNSPALSLVTSSAH